MFKKVMLVVLSLVLLSSMGYALDYIDVSKTIISTPIITQQVNQVLPVVTPLQLQYSDLLVEVVANIPENLKVNDLFWVDIYVTSGGQTVILDSKIKLTSSDANVASFTGKGENGNLFVYNPGGVKFDGGVYSAVGSEDIKPGVRYKLGRLEMQAKAKGAFNINVDKSLNAALNEDNSYATYAPEEGIAPQKYYHLVLNPTTITKVASSVCVPLTIVCPEQICGLLPDGCGGVITCDCTACAAKHTCILPALYLFPGLLPGAGDKQLCEAAINAQSADRDALKGISNAFQSKTLDGQPLKECSGPACKFLKLNLIMTALTSWFSQQ